MPGDDDSQPAPLSDFFARVQLAVARPEREAELAERLAAERGRRRRALRTLAAERDVPEDEDLRAVVLDDDAPETAAMRAVRGALAWRGARSRGLVLVVGGPVGTGKTAALAHAITRTESSALFVRATLIASTPRNGYSENAHAWARWVTVATLAVDDVGAEECSPETVATLLWERYDRGRATLLSTNLARRDFAGRYLSGEVGKRVADRLIHAQGRAVVDTLGRVSIGDGGQQWFAPVEGASLRSSMARAELLARRGQR